MGDRLIGGQRRILGKYRPGYWASTAQAQQATIKEESRVIKTYPFSDPNPLASMAINKRATVFYPYFMMDGYTDKPVNQNWKVISLDNDFINVTVLPEIGGKVMGAFEKSTGKEFVYTNHVVKFRSIGTRGPWTSGGIEHNFGLDLGHAPWAAAPVDYALLKNPDGSVTCVVGGLDLASRSEWRVKINLPKDKAYFETESLWFNPIPLHDAYLSWSNAAYRASDDLRFYFPGNYHIGHNGEAASWPIDEKGRDISYYRNNNFGSSKSYHVMGAYRNWFGGYWEKDNFGFGHWSRFSDAPGKKLWIWSLARDGGIWENLLTDSDGQYIEAQSGAYFNQPGERSGYHSPFRQLSHRPLYAETKSDYWFPVKETGGMADANTYGTLNVSRQGNKLLVSVSPLQDIRDSLTIKQGDKVAHAELLQLKPLQTFQKEIALSSATEATVTVSIGNEKLFYSSDPQAGLIQRPVVTESGIGDYDSGERLFRLAEEQNAMRNFEEAMDLFQQCLAKEPTHSLALSRVAELYYRKAEYKKGLEYARRVLSYSAYDGAANYIYGILQAKLGDYQEALQALSVAVRTMEYRSAAFSKIAEINFLQKDYEEAVGNALKSLDYNKNNLSSYKALIAAYRKLNDKAAANAAIDQLLAIDPLSHPARFERYLVNSDSSAIRAFRAEFKSEFPVETYLEMAIAYTEMGAVEEAITLLKQAPEHPMVSYWLAYLHKDMAARQSADYLARATALSPEMVFPFRRESIPVLEWASHRQDSWKHRQDSWKTLYYLGLINWNNRDIDKAKALFDQCANAPDYAPFYVLRGVLRQAKSVSGGGATDVLADFNRSIELDPGSWRNWQYLINYHEGKNDLQKQLELSKKAYERFPDNPAIRIEYAKALIATGDPKGSISVLNKTLVLPYEGAREGRVTFELANLATARDLMQKSKFREALKYIEQSRIWPESLGAGKPYEPDERLQDLMAFYCEQQRGNLKKAEEYRSRIRSFSLDPEHWRSGWNASNNFIAAAVLDYPVNTQGMGDDKDQDYRRQIEALAREWEHGLDSLKNWGISDALASPAVAWTLAKYHKDEAKAKSLEDKLLSSERESFFRIMINTFELMAKPYRLR